MLWVIKGFLLACGMFIVGRVVVQSLLSDWVFHAGEFRRAIWLVRSAGWFVAHARWCEAAALEYLGYFRSARAAREAPSPHDVNATMCLSISVGDYEAAVAEAKVAEIWPPTTQTLNPVRPRKSRSCRSAVPARLAPRLQRAGLETTADSLFGARVALVQTDSLSGYTAPAKWLKDHGVRLSELGEVVFAGNHSAALALLDSGRVDIAATFDSAFNDYQAKHPASTLTVLTRFEALPNAMLVARASMDEAESDRLVASTPSTAWGSGWSSYASETTTPFQNATRPVICFAASDGFA